MATTRDDRGARTSGSRSALSGDSDPATGFGAGAGIPWPEHLGRSAPRRRRPTGAGRPGGSHPRQAAGAETPPTGARSSRRPAAKATVCWKWQSRLRICRRGECGFATWSSGFSTSKLIISGRDNTSGRERRSRRTTRSGSGARASQAVGISAWQRAAAPGARSAGDSRRLQRRRQHPRHPAAPGGNSPGG